VAKTCDVRGRRESDPRGAISGLYERFNPFHKPELTYANHVADSTKVQTSCGRAASDDECFSEGKVKSSGRRICSDLRGGATGVEETATASADPVVGRPNAEIMVYAQSATAAAGAGSGASSPVTSIVCDMREDETTATYDDTPSRTRSPHSRVLHRACYRMREVRFSGFRLRAWSGRARRSWPAWPGRPRSTPRQRTPPKSRQTNTWSRVG
jgi:hypothetical protein